MSQFKKKLTTFTAMLAFLSLSSAALAVTGADVIGNTGNVGVSGNETRLDVDITSGVNGDVGQVDWNTFNVGSNQQVNFGFSGLSQTIINRVLGGQESQILGKLTNSCIGDGSCSSFAATGKVILINPAGIMFGNGSSVDLNSFTASTFDIKGAKNLGGMSEADLAKYQKDVLNKFSPTAKINGENRDFGNIYFDSNYTSEFEKAGIALKPGETQIVLDGTTFAHFNKDGSLADANPNKSVAIVADNITYKDSLIRTGQNFNYVTPNNNYSLSNVRLITADGVTFGYLANGYADTYEVAQDTKDVARTIEMNNANLKPDTVGIQSGDVHIVNASKNENSNVKISNAVIKGTKLVNKENGDIMIVAPGDVVIDNSRLETVNTSITKNGVTYKTDKQNGGEVYLRAGKDVTIEDSLISTAGAKDDTVNGENAGAVRIYADNKVNMKNTTTLAEGYVDVEATKGINVENSLIKTDNSLGSKTKDVIMISSGNIQAHNSVVSAAGNVDIRSIYSDNSLAGDIIISSDLNEDGQNQSLIKADKKLSIQGSDTKIDNVGLAYEEIKFYNDGTTGQNNVTIANNTTFRPAVDGKVSRDINLETNGNLTFDNATVKLGGYSLKFDTNNDGSNNTTSKNINYELSFTTADADNVGAKSTEGNVNVVNNSNIKAVHNIALDSMKKDTNVSNSDLKTDNGEINISAVNGKVTIKDGSNVIAAKDLNVTAYETITFGEEGDKNINIGDKVNLTAGEDINIRSLGGDINAERTTMSTLTYGDRLMFNAAGSNNFTSVDSLKAVNVDFIAGKSNNFTTYDDIQFVNSSLKAPENNITTTLEGGDVIMNDLTIHSATANPKDTVTKINAKGNVTTKDVLGTATEDVAAAAKEFPQNVIYNGSVTDKTTPDTVLNVNQTKLIVNTQVNKTTPQNNDNGSITLTVKNADNENAGLELTAKNEVWDEQIDKGEGPEVHLNAADNKVAITEIYTDKLTLDQKDTFIAGKDTKDGGMPTITVKDQGGFNLDPNLGYEPGPDGFGYKENYESTSKVVDQTVDKDVDVDVDVETDVVEEDNKTTTTTTTTTTTETTTTTTETTDKKHTITFDNNGNPSDFTLVYDKTTTETDVDTKVTVDVDKQTDVVVDEKCPELPEIDPEDEPLGDNVDSYINIMKLPREQVEISKTSKVSDNTVDQTSSIMSAAAKVDLDAAAESTTSKDKEEKE